MGTGTPDVVIIGSGMGGASVAAGLAGAGARVLMLERGRPIPADAHARDPRAVFVNGHFRPDETWLDAGGKTFVPGNHYNVGGNSKFYGAVLIRYRERDFEAVAEEDGISPAWPFPYAELAPWYDAAEKLYQVRGTADEDPTEPPHTGAYPFPPVVDEPALAAVRARLERAGARPFSLPLGVDVDTWLAGGATPWDGFPDTRSGKMDAETCGIAQALTDPDFTLLAGARVTRLETAPDGRTVAAVHYEREGEQARATPKLVVLAAGAVQSAALLLASGLGNRSDQVGRNFMNHNASAIIAIDPRFLNDSVHQKTFGLNDWYWGDGEGGPPLGNVQLLGRVSGEILRGQVERVPGIVLDWIARHAVDFYAITEDLPRPDSRITLEGNRIRLAWTRSNLHTHQALVARLKRLLRRAGFPIVLSRMFDGRTPSHQCGTVRIGTDGTEAPLDVFGRAFDHPNLFVADASCLPTSAAVNPALTVAALALRTADHIRRLELSA
ncbi:MAG: GMC family oxidoreductase [Pseudomonadota bacterium]